MKLLGWMHRKLMQHNTEPTKNYTLGNHPTCFSIQTLSDKQNYYTDPPKTSSHSTITCDESFDEPFNFLSIGTFGIELLNTDPPTPTFPMPVETLTDQQPIMIAENDLNLINYELEKFIEAEETETGNDSSERSSQASVITLSDQGHMQMIACPLRNYLFAASVDLAETDKEVKKTRMSLEELLKRNSMVHDDPTMKKLEKVAEQDAKKGNVSHFMKKVVKRFNPTSSVDDDDDDDDDDDASNPIKKKLSRTFVKMFHKKIYPEEITEKRFFNNKKKNISGEDAHRIGNSKLAIKKSKKNTMKLFFTGICKGASQENADHWIKTDSDYLVLEL